MMNRNILVGFITAMIIVAMVGCAGSDCPVTTPGTAQSEADSANSQTHLWGLWTVKIDPVTWKVEAIPDRNAMFTANVVNFLNGKISNMGFKINKIDKQASYTDIDIDVTLNHPFPGMTKYNGYDVRGVFMGDGSGMMSYNTDLKYGVAGIDQMMLPDPVDGVGGPDGYTRWFNKTEFSGNGMPLLLYTQGKMATSGFAGTATLNPYKYFADGLSANDDLWSWVNDHPESVGTFSSGASNIRNYYLRFPADKNIVYGYAVMANWAGTGALDHPSNAPEAVGLSVVVTPDIYYVDGSQKGGKLILDLNYSTAWGKTPSTVFIESSVLSSPYQLTGSEMVPVGGGSNYSTYHVEIPADNINGTTGNEFWAIFQYDNYNYLNDFGVPNNAGPDQLASFFRYDLYVSPDLSNTPPVVISGVSGPTPEFTTSVGTYSVAATDIDGDPLTYSWTMKNNEDSSIVTGYDGIPGSPPSELTISWSTVPGIAAGKLYDIYCTVTDSKSAPVPANMLTVTIMQACNGWAQTWGTPDNSDLGYSVATDSQGNSYTVGRYCGTCDFDPGPGVDSHTSGSSYDTFLSKFDTCGEFVWAKTWGGSYTEQHYAVTVDGSDNVYVTGAFTGMPTDFDPGTGVENHSSAGGQDVFVSKFDTSGNFIWAKTWGGASPDSGTSISFDPSGNIYIAGYFTGTIDFDPGAGVDNRTPVGADDIFVSKLDSSGNYLWAKTWGGPLSDYGWPQIWIGGPSVAVDNSGNAFVTGQFQGTADFNPDAGVDSHVSNGLYDIFISKFDSSGAFQWAKTWGSPNTVYGDFGLSAAVDGSGNVYCGGIFTGGHVTDWDYIDFDPGPGVENHKTNGYQDLYLSKFDTNGNFVWARTWGSWGSEEFGTISYDPTGAILISGAFVSTVDFDPGPGVDNHSSVDNIDAFVSKIDLDGNFAWARTWGGPIYDEGFSVASDDAGDVFVTGFYCGPTDFDPSTDVDMHQPIGPSISYDVYLLKLLSNGWWD
jgi:hypothetical protein